LLRKAEADDSIHLIEAALRNFVCSKDADIEQFLQAGETLHQFYRTI